MNTRLQEMYSNGELNQGDFVSLDSFAYCRTIALDGDFTIAQLEKIIQEAKAILERVDEAKAD